MTDAHVALAYADPVQNRMIICGEWEFASMAEQERAFNSLPQVGDSPWIVDFHDAEGTITKDRCVSAETAEQMASLSVAELIQRGNEREDALTAFIRSRGRAA